MYADYYTYRTPGPTKFVLWSGSVAYEVFRSEAEALWRDAKPYDL